MLRPLPVPLGCRRLHRRRSLQQSARGPARPRQWARSRGMPHDHEDRFRRHEEIMEGLARMLAAQHEFNRQQLEINVDVKTTLARIETLIARMLPTGENGW